MYIYIYIYMYMYIYTYIYSTKKILRPWSQQVRQLTPRRGTVAHLGNRDGRVVLLVFTETKKQSTNHSHGESNALHDIAITNIVWCMTYKRRVWGGSYSAHESCNGIAMVWAM